MQISQLSIKFACEGKVNEIYLKQARFACMCCAAGRHFVSARCALWAHGLTMSDHKGDNISKYLCLTVKIDITKKSSNLSIFNFFDA